MDFYLVSLVGCALVGMFYKVNVQIAHQMTPAIKVDSGTGHRGRD